LGKIFFFLVARILYCGDAFVETGFGRVASHLLPKLAEQHDVHVLAVNYWGDHHEEAVKYKVYPAGVHGNDPFGAHRIASIVRQIKPDLIWTTNDFWININLWNQVKDLKEEIGFKFYSYSPIDSYGIFPETMPVTKGWDGFGVYTEFGAEEIKKAGYEGMVDIIPHGVDRKNFFPIDKAECRKKLGVPEDVFIVFNGNRNQPRKRIDLTIKAFIRFAKDRDDARLWMNMGQKDMGWDLIPLFKRVARDEGYDPTGKLILTSPNFDVNNCLTIEQLNQVYNACDVGINTCIGEGWGLVNFEHAATGVAQVVPDHTSLREIFNGVKRIENESWEVDRNYGLDRAVPSADDAAYLLERYYEDRELLAADGQWCYDRVTAPEFNWDNIGDKMLKIVDRLLKKQKLVISSGRGFKREAIK
jgi:glycosyltransferase involved in cell wall biosynthesis